MGGPSSPLVVEMRRGRISKTKWRMKKWLACTIKKVWYKYKMLFERKEFCCFLPQPWTWMTLNITSDFFFKVPQKQELECTCWFFSMPRTENFIGIKELREERQHFVIELLMLMPCIYGFEGRFWKIRCINNFHEPGVLLGTEQISWICVGLLYHILQFIFL